MYKTLLLLFIVSVTGILLGEEADLVLFNGKIITVDADDSIAEAVAVKDSLILAVGTRAEIEPLIGDGTDVRNLNGRTVTPGMIDAHLHLMYYGQGENDLVNLRPPHVTTIQEIVEKIKERIDVSEPGVWIIKYQTTPLMIPTMAIRKYLLKNLRRICPPVWLLPLLAGNQLNS